MVTTLVVLAGLAIYAVGVREAFKSHETIRACGGLGGVGGGATVLRRGPATVGHGYTIVWRS